MSPAERVNPPAEELHRRRWPIFGVMMIAWFMALLDISIVNIAIPDIQQDLSTDIQTASWAVNAYNIAFATVLVGAGRLADQFGRKRLFISGLIIFTIGSGLCAIAWDEGWLIFFRAVQGIGAGVLAPLGFAMTVLVFPPAQRGFGLSLIAVVALVASALGPVLGGAAVEIASWHWVFAINVPFGILAIVMALRVWPETWDLTASRRVDVAGMVLLGLASFSAAFALVEANSRGWDDALILFLLQGAVLFGVAFFLSQRFGKDPMLPPALLANKQFLGANTAMLLFAMGALGALFLLALVFVDLWGFDPLPAGLALLPVPLCGLLVWPIVGRNANTRPPWRTAVPALVIMGIGLIAFSFLPATNESTGDYLIVLPALLMIGVGMGIVFPAINVGAMGAVKGQELGLASGLLNTSRQVGAGLGVAVALTTMSIVSDIRMNWARDELKDRVNNAYELPAPMAQGIFMKFYLDRLGATEDRWDPGPGFDEEAARLAADTARTSYAWAFRVAGLLVLLAVPLARTMRQGPVPGPAPPPRPAAATGSPPPAAATA